MLKMALVTGVERCEAQFISVQFSSVQFSSVHIKIPLHANIVKELQENRKKQLTCNA